MINETLEADRAYQRDKADAYERGYKQGKADAERERKRGKWIEYEQKFMLEESLKTVQKTVRECSVCATKIAGMVGIMNYCPNCGADMSEEDGMADVIDDNRFVLIDKYKQRLIEGTNIESRPEEMEVLDSILFRFWQIGWLDKLEEESHWIPCEERLPEEDKDVLCKTLGGLMFVASYGKLHPWTDEKGWIITPSLERAGISFVDQWMPLPEFKKGVEE